MHQSGSRLCRRRQGEEPDGDEQDADAVPLVPLSSAVESKRFAVDEGKELPDAFAVTVSSGALCESLFPTHRGSLETRLSIV